MSCQTEVPLRPEARNRCARRTRSHPPPPGASPARAARAGAPIVPIAVLGAEGASPARADADLTRALTRQGITGIYTATATKFAVISVTAELTVWTNGHQVWCTHHGQRLTWPAADIETAATRIAALAHPAADS